MQKFKAGDKVQITEGSDKRVGWHAFNVGDIGTIESVGVSYKQHGNTYRVSVEGNGATQVLAECQLEARSLDFTKPVYTAEGTPVQIVTTTGRDAKFPVLGYEGKAKILSKFSLDGKNKNGVERRHLTNDVPAETPAEASTKEVFVNLYNIGVIVDDCVHVRHSGAIGRHHATFEAANADYKDKRRNGFRLQRTGVAKLTIVKGTLPNGY